MNDDGSIAKYITIAT